jgi:diguanylate cyclase (GGDEF)-like protein
VNLDAFSVLNNGLGHDTGDRLLRTVAKRLKEAVAGERALIARTDGDEFAILVEDSPTTPDIPELVGRINEALAEPEYIDGNGVAVSATVGVVRCPAEETTGAELFRAAGVALQSARSAGRGQWMRFDAEQDARAREVYRDAAVLPGAFESGELELGYDPVVLLADRTTVAVRAGLRWTGRAAGALDERETMRVAELTGQSVHLGHWLTRVACANLPPLLRTGPDRDSVLRLRLSRMQSADDGLVAAVLKAAEAAHLKPHLLEIAFDTGAVLDEFGSAPDNLQVLAEIGMRTALCEFSGGPRELALLRRSPARSVILADPFGAGGDDGSAMPPAVELLVVSIKELGASVSVDGVRTKREANRWASVGVDTALGPLFAEPERLEQLSQKSGRAAQ